MNYLLYGMGIGNQSIKKYFDYHNINYQVYEDNWQIFDYSNLLKNVKLIIKSSGIPNNTHFLLSVKEKNIDVVTDLEFFFQIKEIDKCICVTGSNGKTTVTSLLQEILKEEGYEACGNIGIPIFDKINNQNNKLIIEASSYMLEYVKRFRPNVFIILNIEKHHLDHHHTFINYLKAKIKPLKNMGKDDIVIYQKDNVILERIINCYEMKKYSFSIDDDSSNCYYKNSFIYLNNEKVIETDKLNLIGIHNKENVMVALLTLNALNINYQEKINKIYQFKPLSHRLEKVFSNYSSSILFINDSKSTNIHSLEVAIKAIKDEYKNKKFYLIVGGMKINQDYSSLNKYESIFDKIYLYGKAGVEYLKGLAKNHVWYKDLKTLLDNILKEKYENNDIILFSPGAPSYDEFKSFEERGEYFKRIVKKYQAS